MEPTTTASKTKPAAPATKPADRPAPNPAAYGEGIAVKSLHFNRPNGVDLGVGASLAGANLLIAGERANIPYSYEITFYPRVRAYRVVLTKRAGGEYVRMIPETWAMWEPAE